MQKATFFSMGMLAGIVVLLAFALLYQINENELQASSSSLLRQDLSGAETICVQGGSGPDMRDMLWVLYRRKGRPKAAPAPEENTGRRPGRAPEEPPPNVAGEFQLTLAVYELGQASRGRLTLKGVRDITYDVEVPELNSGQPSVRDIKSQLEDAARREADRSKRK